MKKEGGLAQLFYRVYAHVYAHMYARVYALKPIKCLKRHLVTKTIFGFSLKNILALLTTEVPT
jgi:hypothetical protein